MNYLAASVALLASAPAVLAQDALSTTSLRLPQAVRVHAVGQRNNEAMFFDQWQVVETPQGVWAQQDWFEGGAGFVPITLTISDDSETFLYDIRSRRGTRGDRYAKSGTTRVDGLATPLAWARYATHALERGDKVRQTADASGKVVVTLDAPRLSGRSFECTVNPATGELEEVRRADGGYMRYADWRDIGGTLHMPFAVEHYTPAMGQAPPLTRRYTIESAEALDARTTLQAFPLPPDAVVVNSLTGEVTNGAGLRLNVDAASLPPAPVPMASPRPTPLGAPPAALFADSAPMQESPPAGPAADRVLLLLGAVLAVTGLVMYAVKQRVARAGGRGSPRSQAR